MYIVTFIFNLLPSPQFHWKRLRHMGRFSKVFLFYINGTYYILHGDARKSTSGNLSGVGMDFSINPSSWQCTDPILSLFAILLTGRQYCLPLQYCRHRENIVDCCFLPSFLLQAGLSAPPRSPCQRLGRDFMSTWQPVAAEAERERFISNQIMEFIQSQFALFSLINL